MVENQEIFVLWGDGYRVVIEPRNASSGGGHDVILESMDKDATGQERWNFCFHWYIRGSSDQVKKRSPDESAIQHTMRLIIGYLPKDPAVYVRPR